MKGFAMHEIGEICGFIGGAIGIATALPQVVRIRRLGHSDGLALSPWLLMLVQFAAWSAFGLKIWSPSILFANVLTFITTALVVVAITGKTVKNWVYVALGGLATGAFVFLAPSFITDWVLIVLTGSRLPQLVVTWFNRASAKPTAVSISSLVVALTSMSFWMAFAILTERPLIIATTSVAISVTVLTAILEASIARRTSKSVSSS